MADAADQDPLSGFTEVMHRLRAECPWKRGQTHRTLARYLLEETHETLEAIDVGADTGDWAPLCDELGDLMLQVWFHAVIAEEAGEFTLDDVARGITAKMVRRNPHVFGDAARPGESGLDAASVDAAWQAIKQAERPRSSPIDGLPATLPALSYATKAIERGLEPARQSGSHTDVGQRLLALVNEAVTDGVDAEQALRDAVRRRVAETDH